MFSAVGIAEHEHLLCVVGCVGCVGSAGSCVREGAHVARTDGLDYLGAAQVVAPTGLRPWRGWCSRPCRKLMQQAKMGATKDRCLPEEGSSCDVHPAGSAGCSHDDSPVLALW